VTTLGALGGADAPTIKIGLVRIFASVEASGADTFSGSAAGARTAITIARAIRSGSATRRTDRATTVDVGFVAILKTIHASRNDADLPLAANLGSTIAVAAASAAKIAFGVAAATTIDVRFR
jgi:hypothetical protein